MVLGDPDAWSSRFIGVDERIVERIAVLWASCVALLSAQANEDTVTINLVELLSKDPVVRRIFHWVEYQFEPFGTDANGAKFSKGKIDIAVLLDWERQRYLAYECKRLNVVQSDGRRSLANLYVTQGMMRFMTEQYAEVLPMGCMLGYVMDGDIPFAQTQVTSAIASHPPLALVGGPSALPPIQDIVRFLTTHVRATGQAIDLRHTLLPFG